MGSASVLAQIVRLMRDAQGSQAPIQRLADRISAIFVPTVIAIAMVTFAVWWFASPNPTVVSALTAAVSVLIIACPCAMGLAVPTAVMVASGRGAAAGVLIKGGEPLERLAGVDTVVLDKTGTHHGRHAASHQVARGTGYGCRDDPGAGCRGREPFGTSPRGGNRSLRTGARCASRVRRSIRGARRTRRARQRRRRRSRHRHRVAADLVGNRRLDARSRSAPNGRLADGRRSLPPPADAP